MTSKMVRRSAISVAEYCQLIGWQPDWIYMVGVGVSHEEADEFKERWPKVGIVGFEPNPDSLLGIKDTFPGILFRYAVSDENRIGSLYWKSNWKNGSSLKAPSEKGWSESQVSVVTLDVFYPPVNQSCLLWLDCEGSELDVLEGGVKFLENVQSVNVEMTGRPRGERWASPKEIHGFLQAHGFLQSWIHTTRIGNVGQYDAIYLRREIFKPEFCCCLGSLDSYHDRG